VGKEGGNEDVPLNRKVGEVRVVFTRMAIEGVVMGGKKNAVNIN
jgi:hypothetical protein